MNTSRLFRDLKRSEGGFTLIELLVVIAILGIIAAVVVLNIGQFMGEGAEEAANTEAHQVQTAVIAYMQAHDMTSLPSGVSVAPGDTDIGAFLLNPSRLQCTYDIGTDGGITLGHPAGKFSECDWNNGAWETC